VSDYLFDIVFIDCGATKPYNVKDLENRPMGGVESSVIRVAEGLGALGLKVAVIKASDTNIGVIQPFFEPIYGQNVFYMHEDYIPRIETKFAVHLRGPRYLPAFKDAKHFVWLHDLANDMIKDWLPHLKQYDATLVGVSRWHKRDIKNHIDYDKITYAYNPVADHLYTNVRDVTKVNKNLMVWASSPHKGLDNALGTFKKIKARLPLMQLLIYHPGYMDQEPIINPGTLFYGPTGSRHVWHNLKKALCLFYPSDFKETFGLVVAEANALGVPVAGYPVAAIKEIISNDQQLSIDEDDLIERICQWHEHPITVPGRDEFKISNVVATWLRIFAGKL
jgi:glycosyltransferase involved in cell wall biosynthesis